MEYIIEKIRRMGLMNFLFHSAWLFHGKICSVVRIFFLRLRLYDIDYSALLGSNLLFFQSEKRSITIKDGCYIGDRVKIKAGFGGKICLEKSVLIDDYSILDAHSRIYIGEETMIASHVYIIDYNHKYPLSKTRKDLLIASGYETKPITIGKHVWIGTHAVILRGVTIGNDAVIGAGAVVTKNVPANSVAVGNPARIIKGA